MTDRYDRWSTRTTHLSPSSPSAIADTVQRNASYAMNKMFEMAETAKSFQTWIELLVIAPHGRLQRCKCSYGQYNYGLHVCNDALALNKGHKNQQARLRRSESCSTLPIARHNRTGSLQVRYV